MNWLLCKPQNSVKSPQIIRIKYRFTDICARKEYTMNMAVSEQWTLAAGQTILYLKQVSILLTLTPK